MIWYTILELSGIKNLDTIPKLTDPESIDVKVVLNFYSLESFLFKKLNRSSREKDTAVISTVGPFAVALNKVINNVQSNRNDGIQGEFTCYSGLALPRATIDLWKK